MLRDDGPVLKRRRVTTGHDKTDKHARQGSRIFAPFRTVGLVSPTPVPFVATAQGKTTYQITTSAGRCLQTFDLKKGLRLIFITRPQTKGSITATATWGDRVMAAWAADGAEGVRGVWLFKRGKRVGMLETPKVSDENIVQVLVFGSWIVGCCTTKILVWKSSTLELYTCLEPPFASSYDGQNKLTGGVCSMPTFVNKIFAGREDGRVEIWNLSTGKLLYTLQSPSADSGPVTALQPTPALSLLAIAYMDGNVSIQDVRTDIEVIKVKAGIGQQSPTTSISFRSDGLGAGADGRKAGIMATASYNSGDVTLWDLNGGGRKIGSLRVAHGPSSHQDGKDGGVSKIEFLPGQAILVSSGLDNSLKTWVFDQTPFSPIPRILHSRTGHAAPITTLKFLPSDADGADAGGKWLLSSGQDRSLWGWSLRRDAQSTELSQGNIAKKTKALGTIVNGNAGSGKQNLEFDSLKASEITCLACSLNRDGGIGALPGVKTLWASAKQQKGKSTATEKSMTGWESVVTGHSGDKFARTWFWGRKRAGRWILETGDGSEVTSVAISPCGTFALIGSKSGSIDMYNLQSGLHRQRFPAKLTPAQAKHLQHSKPDQSSKHVEGLSKWARGHGRHTAAVTGLEVDNLNRTVVSCSSDGKIKFWDFISGNLYHEVDWSYFTGIDGLKYHRPSDLIALKCSDFYIRVVDIESKKVVREIRGESPVLDFCFSNDGRWIVASCQNSTICTWDLPTGHLVDMFRLQCPCTALAFSYTGEFLATALEDSVGIDIWTNRTLFKYIPTRNISESEASHIVKPSASGENGQGILESLFEESVSEEDEMLPEITIKQVDQLRKDVETLSLLPRSRWQTLVHLDLIRERNKPIEAPKPPEKLPFFLSASLQSTKPLDEVHSSAGNETTVSTSERSRIAKMDRSGGESQFSILLREGTANGDYTAFIGHLKTLPPSVADLEIRSLNPTPSSNELCGFVNALTERLHAKLDYELVQAWMSIFLRLHGELLQQDQALVAAVRRWRSEQQTEAKRLSRLVGYCAGVVGFLRSTR